MTAQNGAAVLLVDLVALLSRARRRVRAADGDTTQVPEPSPIDGNALSRELDDLFWATGVADDGSEERAIWFEFRKEDEKNEDHAADAGAFRRIARASNPLSPKVCFGAAAAAMHRKIKGRASRMPWSTADAVPAVTSIDWNALTAEQQALVRTMAHELAAYHKGLVKAHRPTKALLDTLMDGLAELFVRYSDQSRSTLQLETAPDSLFIQFCHAALAHFGGSKPFAMSEIAPASLSQRWRRLKRRAAG